MSSLLDAPPPIWDGSGEPPSSLSATDLSFWRASAYSATNLTEAQKWFEEGAVGHYDDSVEVADTLGWCALDESADEILQSTLASGIYRDVQLTGSNGKTLEDELLEVRTLSVFLVVDT